jgi:hypothetical protein
MAAGVAALSKQKLGFAANFDELITPPLPVRQGSSPDRHRAVGAGVRDSPLEGDGFEPWVPRQKHLCNRSPPIASTGGADRPENGENADLAPSLRHRKLVEQLEGFRDGAGENSGCEVALQVLGSLPVTSSRPFIGEPR